MNPVSISWWESPASWAMIASIVVVGGNAILPLLPVDIAASLGSILGIIGVIFHVKTVNTALGATH